MVDPLTGAAIVALLPPAMESIANGAVGVIVADAYNKLKACLKGNPALAQNLAQLEAKPTSPDRAGVLAELIDEQAPAFIEELRPLVEALRAALASAGQQTHITHITNVTATDHSYAAGGNMIIGSIPSSKE